MSEHGNVELARDLINAWNARDLLRYRALLSDDCVVERPHEAPTRGRDAACSTLERYLDGIPDIWFEVTDVAANEHMAVVNWRARGTVWRDGRDGGTTRTPLEVRGFTVVGLKHGKIARLWHEWDPDEIGNAPRADDYVTLLSLD